MTSSGYQRRLRAAAQSPPSWSQGLGQQALVGGAVDGADQLLR